jgi:hypothetical protein
VLLQIAIQVALILAKVARFDFPKEWPTLFSELLSGLPNASTLAVRRTYLVLHHVLKELASKRLVADQKNFAEVRAQVQAPAQHSLFLPLRTRFMHSAAVGTCSRVS